MAKATESRRLTDDIVRNLHVPAKGTARIWDHPDLKRPKLPWVSGFGVRLSAGGSKTFILRYRARGTERLLTIGDFPTWSTDAGRDEAQDLKRRIKDGADPMAERMAERMAETVAQLADKFLDVHASKKRPATQRGYRMLIAKNVRPHLGKRKVADVTRKDVERLHDEITKRGSPYAANRTLATLSVMFGLAVQLGLRPDNPCKGVARNSEEKRRRYLTADELSRLTRVLAEYEDQQAANAVRLLLLTGARKNEVLACRWDALDLQRNVWTRLSSETKTKRTFEVPISEPALELLHAMRRDALPDAVYLFPGETDGRLGDLKQRWTDILQRAGIAALRVHDLRHSFASFAVSAGHSLEIIGSLLGHSQIATTQRYAHLHDQAKREAANKVGSILSGLVAKRPKARKLKVVAGSGR
jgi:integrase